MCVTCRSLLDSPAAVQQCAQATSNERRQMVLLLLLLVLKAQQAAAASNEARQLHAVPCWGACGAGVACVRWGECGVGCRLAR